ncbi:MAG: penicillin-binding protein [Actinobacteria bacterium]|nr:penicillin-binding protein [Actinomycetota bacterium]NBO35115.1 penicillin-binding protein [Actinomycetota bacterium]
MENNPGGTGLDRVGLLTRMATFVALAGVVGALIVLPVIGGVGLATRNSAQAFNSLPSDLTQVPLPQQNTLLDADGNILAVLYAQNRIEVPIEKISPLMQQAIIAIEDQRFFNHAGIDFKGTLRASISTGAGGQVQGGSTITQQYVKQILLTAATTKDEQEAAVAVSINRKIREARYAIGLENKLSKMQILEGYLNIAYFGAGSYGVEIASQRYFSKSANQLTLSEAATLAGLVQNPSRYDPTRFPERAENRRNEVLNAMVDAGYITQEQSDQAKAIPVKTDLKPAELSNGCVTSYAPFFCDYVLTVLMNDPVFGDTPEARARLLAVGGLTIKTTLSRDAQVSSQKAVDEKIPFDDASGKAAAITMIRPGTGEITAMAQNRKWGRSGAGYTTVNYNVPVSANGTVGFQAGSTFKTFTIGAAFKLGWDPFKVISAPGKKIFKEFKECGTGAKFAPYPVRNSTGSGAFDIFSGAAFSVNTYFVGLEEKIGLCEPLAIAKAAGVQQGNGEDFKGYPCFTLGCFDVTTLDMTEGMATFAAHGVHCDPIAISAVTDRYKNELEVPSANCIQKIDVEVADSTTAVLAGVVDGPLGGRTGRAMYFDRPAAGKTGTTDNSAAVWFVGYTPDMAAAVWVGDPRGGQTHPMKNVRINGQYYGQVFGSTMPGPIWRDALRGALAKVPATPWNLKTLNGINAGGFGNTITASKDACGGLKDTELITCETEQAMENFADELKSGELVIDPLTGKAIPNPALVDPVPTETPVPNPDPSSSMTTTP